MNEKPLRCNMNISTAPLLIWAILLPPPWRPTTCQHETRQHRVESGGPTQLVSRLLPLASQPHHPAAPWAVLSSTCLPTYMLSLGGGGKKSEVDVQFESSLKSKTVLSISGNLVTEKRKLLPPPRV